MRSIVLNLDDADFDKLVNNKNLEAKRLHRIRLSWREYFLLVAEIENGTMLDRNGNLIKQR